MTGAPEVKSWQEMRDWQIGLLERGSGATLAEWTERIREQAPGSEQELRDWLSGQGVQGYAQMLLVHETFGYPEFLLQSADELIDAQYEDRPGLRPVLDAVLLRAAELGEVTVQVRKTFVALVGPRRTFARVRPTTRTRLDVGLRIPSAEPDGRLLTAKGLGDGMDVRVPLTTVEEVDEPFAGLLRRAYDANAL
ncbi:DUF5655 domain-containing protein [Streptomyces sp. LHD-70]|uniref:DUF5655 domain-containing protein n=1 Tax=Streptomyces sp. LHD-70 TaxID=3072140 RepID=UPI00280F2D52|nr:DUF5655 domain-containing protein [Streptomyces sp. LHD-70]MDQ8705186.1 DUF5655 domain-containing protein [Streptomyces sp. LHD-70]